MYADLDKLSTWSKFKPSLCRTCQGTCCSLPVEVRMSDLVRLGFADEFELGEPAKSVAKRLSKAGLIEHFNAKHQLFTLSRRSNGDCALLDPRTRLCTVYERRPDTCRNHPQVGPRPGYCAYRAKG